ncbi:WXG100 family type VII secretion target [[Mycobacterium] wendilense]|uniref:WXG100 family type VII secretion target n=1 Tax=[Mycobacterium] wendilense TaxID=3064284 RepID=A0ABN9P1A8_9MYCO|nr:type VII secretion target [Mycolicibacterium sp. MU0050]CAJ1584813.1 WXG100 family type VII secretion target [Mycolicibacterium sp. MU0050]
MGDPNMLAMTTSDVIYSADFLDSIGTTAGAERRALAAELSGHGTAWQEQGRPGFAAFIDVVNRQAQRTETELVEVADKLRQAARDYTTVAEEGAEALRYHRPGPAPL